MKPPSLSDQASIRFNTTCHCGRYKNRGHWLCQTCFDQLSKPFQKPLLRGGAEAYVNALRFLRELEGGIVQRYLKPVKAKNEMPRLGWVGD
jgi:hypothetical protein